MRKEKNGECITNRDFTFENLIPMQKYARMRSHVNTKREQIKSACEKIHV